VRPIRITGNIFVANLPPGFTDARLAELFDPFGLVLHAYLARDPETGAVRNHGLVDLAPAAAMSQAIAALDGTDIEGQRIAVRTADPGLALRAPSHRAAPRQQRPRATVSPPEPTTPPAPRPAVIVERRPLARRIRPVE
jgi:RNA recognition motif-containing protein